MWTALSGSPPASFAAPPPVATDMKPLLSHSTSGEFNSPPNPPIFSPTPENRGRRKRSVKPFYHRRIHLPARFSRATHARVDPYRSAAGYAVQDVRQSNQPTFLSLNQVLVRTRPLIGRSLVPLGSAICPPDGVIPTLFQLP
eukprot:1182921-Prorocentrum_minimum.AAC.3